ncbi:MAG: nuclear transport factor 2 family protein, partial [Nocardioidaceae bacterium]
MWFAANRSGDHDSARALLAKDISNDVDGHRTQGFDAFMEWYVKRMAVEGPGFRYSVLDVLAGERYAAAVLRPSRADGSTWRRVDLYEIAGNVINRIIAFQDPHPPPPNP